MRRPRLAGTTLWLRQPASSPSNRLMKIVNRSAARASVSIGTPGTGLSGISLAQCATKMTSTVPHSSRSRRATTSCTARSVPGYGRADVKRATVTAGATRTVTVRHFPLSTVVVTSKNSATQAAVLDVCYWLKQVERYSDPGYFAACDRDDGSVDGVVRISGVDRGPHVLSQVYAPPSYFKPSDRRSTSPLSTPPTQSRSIRRNPAGSSSTSATSGRSAPRELCGPLRAHRWWWPEQQHDRLHVRQQG